ncbi:hypothetical protein [Methyloglobulus sp.]|uniref:hypothetical protein n=1 Tax=Methyloglobulus sp. TaxID=2518622 RepID=UPI0032B7B6D9
MSQSNELFKKNLFYLAKTYLVLICIFLLYWGCMGMSFFTFPIEGCMGEYGPYQQLPEYLKIALTILFYILLMGIFATHFFYQAKCFYNDNFYFSYRKFWQFGSVTLSVTWLVLLGLLRITNYQNRDAFEFIIYHIINDFIFIAIHAAIFWHLTTAPANNQHEMKTNPPHDGLC